MSSKHHILSLIIFLCDDRFYSAREVARLQGFPETFTLDCVSVYARLGNSVCPPLIAFMATEIVRALQLPASHDSPSPHTLCRQTPRLIASCPSPVTLSRPPSSCKCPMWGEVYGEALDLLARSCPNENDELCVR